MSGLAALVTVAAGGPAGAQQTGTRLSRDATAKDATLGFKMIVGCIVERQPAAMEALLETLPGSVAEDRILAKYNADMSICLQSDKVIFDGKAVSFSRRLFRPQVAIYLAQRRVPQMSVDSRPDPATKPWFEQKVAHSVESKAVDNAALATQEFGFCIVMADWDAATALLRSASETPEEQDAITRLRPVIGPCLQKEVTLKLTAASLRSVIAEPIYHLIAKPPARVSATKL